MRPAPRWGWALALFALALALLAFVLLRGGGEVDPNTAVPRGANAPTQEDPQAAALREALKKAQKP